MGFNILLAIKIDFDRALGISNHCLINREIMNAYEWGHALMTHRG